MATPLQVSVLDERLAGLSTALENASMEKSKQRNLLSSMKKELKETQDFISVSDKLVRQTSEN